MRNYMLPILTCLTSVILSSCSESVKDFVPPASSDSSYPVSFSALAQWDDAPNARLTEDGNSTSFTSGDAIGVFAYHNGSTTPNFMNNQKVTFDGNGWTYEPVKYWPADEDDALDFYAYYPYDCKEITSNVSSTSPSIVYRQDKADTDILAAKSEQQNHTYNNGSIQLNFNHLLAKVKFTFSASGTNHPVIHALKYEIPVQGIYNYTEPAEWASISDNKNTLSRLVNKSEGQVINTTNEPIDEFTAYILPCEIDKFSVSINNVFTDFTARPVISIKAGYQYTINFVISDDESNVFITSYSLWDTDGNTYDGQLK